MAKGQVIVVGAGIGGLAAAALIAARGFPVTVLERAAAPGGKVAEIAVDGRPIDTRFVDTGPTVFTLRHVVEGIFREAGGDLSKHVTLAKLDVLARHAWREGEVLDLYADEARSADAIGRLMGAQEARGYRAFCAEVRRIYATLDDTFMQASRPNLPQLMARISQRGVQGLKDLWHLQPYTSMWTELAKFFKDERLRQLFGRYATYCGSSPFHAPGTLMLVAHVETMGVWSVEGGMGRLAAAFATLATNAGAVIRTGAHVEEIVVSGDRVTGVRLADGERIGCDAVVFNGDCAALGAGLLGRGVAGAVAPTPVSQRSLSAVTLAGVARTSGFPLVRHNVFFSGNYAAEFDDILKRGRPPAEPTVYVCAQDRGGDGANTAADGAAERLLCLINAPATGDRASLTTKEIEQCRERIFSRLNRCGLRVISQPQDMVTSTPSDFHRRFPGTGGALYGQASHGWMASFQRAGSRTKVRGLYLAGGSTHPGPGVPMSAQSGRLAAHCLIADSTSTTR